MGERSAVEQELERAKTFNKSEEIANKSISSVALHSNLDKSARSKLDRVWKLGN
jgi:hypothetical protein